VSSLCFSESRDHIAESREGEVDLSRLIKSLACGSRLTNAFRAGQIHEIEFANLDP
jgi:hypothetical protein